MNDSVWYEVDRLLDDVQAAEEDLGRVEAAAQAMVDKARDTQDKSEQKLLTACGYVKVIDGGAKSEWWQRGGRTRVARGQALNEIRNAYDLMSKPEPAAAPVAAVVASQEVKE